MPKPNQENQLKGPIIVKSVVPKNRQELIKWNGWGYNDSKFVVKEGPVVYFSGKRYLIGELPLPHIAGWARETFNIDIGVLKPKKIQELPSEDKYPNTKITNEFLEKIGKLGISYSIKLSADIKFFKIDAELTEQLMLKDKSTK